MSSMATPTFTHEPLPDALTHIRLLEVLQARAGQHTLCSVSIWPLEMAPSFDAISYTWGDPALMTQIILNGEPFPVRQNCNYVMQQWYVAHTSESKYIWVDAVCIDQENLKERACQVTIMGELYQRSTQVLACVGSHADDSEFLVSFCRREKIFLDQLHSKNSQINFSEDVWADQWSRRIKEIFRPLNLETTPVNALFIWPSTRLRLRSACVAFMQRAYFARVWIIQELHMGTNVSYCCGMDVIPSAQILAVHLLADPAFEDQFNKEYPWLTAGIQKMSSLTSKLSGKGKIQSPADTNYESIKPYLACLGLAAENREHFELEGVLRFIHHFQCTDKRDRLYGTLALVRWQSPWGRQPISTPIPDYEKNPFKLAAEVFRMLSPGLGLGIEDTGYALSWVQQLFEVFALGPSDQVMRDLLVKRYTIVPQEDGDDQGAITQMSDRVGDYSWRSIRICDASSSEAREHYTLHCAEAMAGDQVVTLLDHGNIPFAQVPPQTTAGDFYIEMDRSTIWPRSWWNLGIIVKGSRSSSQESTQHSLLGLARRFTSQTSVHQRHWVNLDHEKFKTVDVHWDVDDIFLLYVSTLHQAALSIQELVLLRICDPLRMDSSFARFSW